MRACARLRAHNEREIACIARSLFYTAEREVLSVGSHVRAGRTSGWARGAGEREGRQPRRIDTLIDVMRVIEFSNHSF